MWYICMFMSVCLCVCVCVCIRTHMSWHTCKSQRSRLDSSSCLLLSLRRCLAHELLWSLLYSSPILTQDCSHIRCASAPSLHGLWASNLRSSCLLGKHVTHADTSKFTRVWISALVIGLKSLLVHRKSTHSCLMIYNQKKKWFMILKEFSFFFSQEINCISLHILKSAVLIYILSASLVAFII